MGWKEKLKEALGPRPGSWAWKRQQRRKEAEEAKKKMGPTQEAEELLDLYERKRLISDRSIGIIRRQGKNAVKEEINSAASGLKASVIGALIFFGISSFVFYAYWIYLPMMIWPLSYYIVLGFFASLGALCGVGALSIYERRKCMYRLLEAFERAES